MRFSIKFRENNSSIAKLEKSSRKAQHEHGSHGPRIHSIYPYMDFGKSTVIHMDIHDFGMSVFNSPFKCGYRRWYSNKGYPCKDILQWMSVEHEHPCFYGYQYSFIHAFTDILLDIHWFLWISIDFYGYPYMDLLWILDRGRASVFGEYRSERF